MYYVSFLAFLLLHICSSVQAQTTAQTTDAPTTAPADSYAMPMLSDTLLKPRGQAFFGIKAGVSQSTLYGEDVSDISNDGLVTPFLGFHAGIHAHSTISDYLWLKHELFFQQMGAIITINHKDGAYTSTLRTELLTLFPASVALHWNGLQLYGGGYMSMLINANIRRKDSTGAFKDDDSIFGNPTETTEDNKYLQKIDAGIVVGVEYEFAFGLNIGIRYTQGFVPVFDNANVHTFGQDKPVIGIYRSGLHATLGWSFR